MIITMLSEKSSNLEIIQFDKEYSKQVIDLILSIQNEEFLVDIDIEAQSDLLKIENFYIHAGGNFLIALYDSKLVGTIGILKISDSAYAIRKMFVAKDYRGKEYKIAQNLLEKAMSSLSNDSSEIYLGTINKYQAAIRFYTKNGFSIIEKDQLPSYFPRMEVDNVFMVKELRL